MCFPNVKIMIICMPNNWLNIKICDTLADYYAEELVGVYSVSNMLHVSPRDLDFRPVFLTNL